MKKLSSLSVLLLCTAFCLRLNAQNIFLKAVAPAGGDYGGIIKGGSLSEAHENEIEVISYSAGLSACTPNFSNGGGQQACKPSIGSLNFLMPLSGGVNQLKYSLLTGLRLLTADFAFEKPSDVGPHSSAYYRIHMEDVVVVSVQESGSDGGGVPTVSIELAASRVAWAMYTVNPQGTNTLSSKLGYNLATNTVWNYAF